MLLRTTLVVLLMQGFAFSSAHAAFIGSQEFDLTFTPPTGDLGVAFTLSSVESATNSTGDFTGLPQGTIWGNFSLNAFNATGMNLVITNPDFGTFSGTVMGDTGEVFLNPSFFRNLSVTGTFTPGSNAIYGGDSDTVSADLSITITRANEASAIGGGLTLVTSESTVPEPSSIALLGLAAIGGLVYRKRRAKQA